MPLNLSPSQLAFNARGDGSFKLPFSEQIDFFKQKLNLPTEHYDDILKSAHDRAFIVAGAAKADLLDDLRKAVDKSIVDGKSIKWFRQNFESIVKQHGWEGWTGSDTKDGRDWRTRVIYNTNVMSSYAAGRYAQLTDPDLLKVAPYWKYVHDDRVLHPRPHHLEWDGLIIHHDDPWWHSHFAPNGWGCRCRVTAVTKREYVGDIAPDDGTWVKKDRNGVNHIIPKGIDYGWDYAPGASVAQQSINIHLQKLDNIAWQLAKASVSDLVDSPVFKRFFNGDIKGEFPIAVLPPSEQALLGAETAILLLSQESLAAHILKHPELGFADYLKIQDMLEKGDLYKQGENRLVYIMLDGIVYRAALKRTMDGKKNYFLTLFKNDKAAPPKDAVRIR